MQEIYSITETAKPRRVDIDILRALAVIAVIGFHFEIPGFSGGFLGVDIFFVISGYLISMHIWEQADQSAFQFIGFYLRRIRRLYPALIAILILSSVFAQILLPRVLRMNYQDSLLWTTAYLSNIHFWSIADYFDTESILKPLLHTWSLSVEEQFYLVWPAFLLITLRRRRFALIGAGLLSLVGAEIARRYAPSAAFYWFPFRIFEFCCGAVVCLAPKPNLPHRPQAFLFAIAVIILGGSVGFLASEANGPGLLTLLLCMATAAIIWLRGPWFNHYRWWSIPFLRIGLISYSAYLVHWPLVVFYKIRFPGPLDPLAQMALCAVTYLLAELLFQCIERPAGRINLKTNRLVFSALVPLLILGAFAFRFLQPNLVPEPTPVLEAPLTVAQILDRIPARKDGLKAIEAEVANQPESLQKKQMPELKILVIGDSHSIDVYWALKIFEKQMNWNVQSFHSICDPLAAESIPIQLEKLYQNHSQNQVKDPDYCREYHRDFLSDLAGQHADILIFSEAWREDALPYLPDTLKALKNSTGSKILLLGRNFQFGGSPLTLLGTATSTDQMNLMSWERRYKRFDSFDQTLDQIAEETDTFFISKFQLVCPDKSCDMVVNNDFTYTDEQHWSPVGIHTYGERLLKYPEFQKLLKAARKAQKNN